MVSPTAQPLSMAWSTADLTVQTLWSASTRTPADKTHDGFVFTKRVKNKAQRNYLAPPQGSTLKSSHLLSPVPGQLMPGWWQLMFCNNHCLTWYSQKKGEGHEHTFWGSRHFGPQVIKKDSQYEWWTLWRKHVKLQWNQKKNPTNCK